jgi:hypothetical protein
MSTTQIGSGVRKETVYEGPAAETAPVRLATRTAPPMAGTVYPGPAAPAAADAAVTGTIYDPARHRAILDHAHTTAHVQREQEVSKAGRIFYLIAGITTINTILTVLSAGFVLGIGLGVTRVFDQQLRRGGDLGGILLVDAAAIAMFIILGIFAQHGSKGALFLGFALYGGDMLLLFSDGVVQHAPSLLVHGLLLFGIFRTFRSLEH